MEKISLKVWNRVLLGKGIAMEIEAVDEKNRRWVSIIPNSGKQLSEISKNYKYQIFDFELDKI